MFNLYTGESLSEFEKDIVTFLDSVDVTGKAKDHYLADLSWAGTHNRGIYFAKQTKEEVTVEFFTKRGGRLLLDQMPEHLKNKILAYSL